LPHRREVQISPKFETVNETKAYYLYAVSRRTEGWDRRGVFSPDGGMNFPIPVSEHGECWDLGNPKDATLVTVVKR
jgi:hypothetical protein